jgi:sialate O-acetylesterase
MEWALRITENPGPVIAASANPKLRLFTVPKLKSDEPVTDVKSFWAECGPTTVSNFSAVAYYFGRDLQKSLGIPVGLIHTSWGGSPAEVWMSREVLGGSERYQKEIVEPYTKRAAALPAEIAAWEKESEQAKKEGRQPARGRPNAGWKPTELYNGMIAPLLPYGIRGAIWYQGESNAGRAEQYRALFADMIRNWRADFRQGEFPFLCVQLAPWDFNRKRSIEEITASPGDSTWAELREAQGLATRALRNVGMAVITDVGDKDDIHPQKKEPVGARLALSARRIAYGEAVLDRGPVYRSLKVRGPQAVLTFDSVGEGLESRGGVPSGFAVCGEDRKWVWANATIDGRDRIIVTSPSVARPVAVRFGWADFPVVNLFNRAGLPASPFRTDDFPLTTQGKF